MYSGTVILTHCVFAVGADVSLHCSYAILCQHWWCHALRRVSLTGSYEASTVFSVTVVCSEVTNLLRNRNVYALLLLLLLLLLLIYIVTIQQLD